MPGLSNWLDAGRDLRDFMAFLTTKTGPGGTELVVRAHLTDSDKGPQVEPIAPATTECGAWHLRQAVDLARREGSREQLETSLHRRQQFWMDTCREVHEMRTASRQVLELHRHQGCRFCAPTARQAQHILDALDSALPGWERDHPGLFFGTLELNFPELLRICRTHRRG